MFNKQLVRAKAFNFFQKFGFPRIFGGNRIGGTHLNDSRALYAQMPQTFAVFSIINGLHFFDLHLMGRNLPF